MKKVLISLLSAIMVIGFSGIGNAAKPAKVHQLKWGHVTSTTFSSHIAAEKVAKEVLEKTNGAVEITIYPASQLGSQREMTESVQTGVVDIVFSSSHTLSAYVRQAQVLDLPFLFRDREHVYNVLDSPLRDEIFAGVNKTVGPIVAIWENSFRNLMNRIKPIRTPEDMAGMKFRVLESKAYIKVMEHLGAKATPMSYGELYTALQQGTVDGADSGFAAIFVERFYEVASYLTKTQYTYSCSPVILSPMLEKKIGAENYAILVDTIQDNTKWQRDLAIEHDKMYSQKLIENGAKIVELSAEELAAFRDRCTPVWTEFEPVVGKALIEKIAAAGKK